ncbi:HET-domain-containing protein [Hypoxylon sp. FL1150]|nr:HET-domain-containing protein [Hypoxylon sp. FL1150]
MILHSHNTAIDLLQRKIIYLIYFKMALCSAHHSAWLFNESLMMNLEDLLEKVPICSYCELILQAVERYKPGWVNMALREPHSGQIEVKKYDMINLQRVTMYKKEDDTSQTIPVFSFVIIHRSPRKCSLTYLQKEPRAMASSLRVPRAITLGEAAGIEMCRNGDVLEDSSTQAAFKRAARWLSHCVNLHKSCKPPNKEFVPQRLLDVGLKGQKGYPRLFEPSGPVTYACLSYCWGNDVAGVLITTTSNLQDHYRGIHPNSMPKSVSDALRVCRGLGIQYLWVDSLCVVQDDRAAWHRDASMMDLIYLNSHVTIAALEPSSCKTGFLGKQKYGRSGWQFCSKLRGTSAEVVIRPAVGRVRENSLDKRAWCLQETLLPNRRLCFDGNEMIWECSNCKTCECGHHVWPADASSGKGQAELDFGELGSLLRNLIEQPTQLQIEERTFHIASMMFDTASRPKSEYSNWLTGITLPTDPPKPMRTTQIPSPLDLIKTTWIPSDLRLLPLQYIDGGRMEEPREGKPTSRIQTYELWRNVIIRYSIRSLSQPTDKLLAVAGLANIIRLKTQSKQNAKDEYLAGLWRKELPFDLSWQVITHEKQPETLARREKGAEKREHGFPSWSWASCSEAIAYDFALTPWNWKCETEAINKCVFVKAEGLSEDGNSTADGSFIRLAGMLAPVGLKREPLNKSALRDHAAISSKSPTGQRNEIYAWVRSRNLRTVRVTLDRIDCPSTNTLDTRDTCWRNGACEQGCCTWDHSQNDGNAGYYCFRLFTWVATEQTEKSVEPETWFLVVRPSIRVEGAFERVGAGKSGDYLFDAAGMRVINII